MDKLLEENNVKRKFRTLMEKKKHLMSMCKYSKIPSPGAGKAASSWKGEEGEEGEVGVCAWRGQCITSARRVGVPCMRPHHDGAWLA